MECLKLLSGNSKINIQKKTKSSDKKTFYCCISNPLYCYPIGVTKNPSTFKSKCFV